MSIQDSDESANFYSVSLECSLFLLAASQFVLNLPHNLHELIRTDGSQDMPPAMELEEPGPGEAHPLPQPPELGAELEVDVPEGVAHDEDGESPPPADAPAGALLLGEPGRAPPEEVVAAGGDEDNDEEEGRRVVDDLAGPDVEGREEREDDGEAGVDEAVVAAAPLLSGQDALQECPGEPEHRELVGELHGLAEGRVEEKRGDAEDEQGD